MNRRGVFALEMAGCVVVVYIRYIVDIYICIVDIYI